MVVVDVSKFISNKGFDDIPIYVFIVSDFYLRNSGNAFMSRLVVLQAKLISFTKMKIKGSLMILCKAIIGH